MGPTMFPESAEVCLDLHVARSVLAKGNGNQTSLSKTGNVKSAHTFIELSNECSCTLGKFGVGSNDGSSAMHFE